MRTCALLVVATVAAVALASMWHPAQAVTVIPIPTPTASASGTCQAAHDADTRVNATFCTTRLLKEPSAIDADTRGLASAAAAVGVRNAEAARTAIGTALRPRDEGSDEQGGGRLYRDMLERCDMVYGIVSQKYEAAREAIKEQRYGAVESELSSVSWFGHSCDAGIALARRASPFVQYSVDNKQIVLITLAITGLIK